MRTQSEEYLLAGCTEENCSLCRLPPYARKAGMSHAGLTAAYLMKEAMATLEPLSQAQRVAIAKREIRLAIADFNAAEGRKLPVPADFELELVGSTYIADKTDSDVDILFCLPDEDLDSLFFSRWNYGGSEGMGRENHWMSWSRTVDGVQINMLITNKREYLHLWLTSAEVCRFLHLKGIPIPTAVVHGIHEIIMDDSTAEAELQTRTY